MEVKRFTKEQVEAITFKNHARRFAKLPLLKIRVINCILCNRPFETVGNRTCGCDSKYVTPEVAGLHIL